MPPHCDSLDGPVVTAARDALVSGDVKLVLAFVPESGEEEIRKMFKVVLPVRVLGEEARDVADRLFFETVVRVHRVGEGAPYTGLKPAGLDVGPVIPLAQRAITNGSSTEVADFLAGVLRDQLKSRLDQVNTLGATKDESTARARAWVEAMLDFQVYSHRLLETINAPAHNVGGHGRARDHA